MKKHIVAKSKVAVIVSILLVCAVGCSNKTQTSTEDSQNIETSSASETMSEEVVGEPVDESIPEIDSKVDPFVEKLMSFGFTESEAMDNAIILEQCGIPTIDICEPASNESIDNLVVFRGVMDDDRTIWFTVENRKIFYVSLNGEDLYDEDKGGYLKNFDEVHIPESSISVEVADTLRNKTESVLDSYFASSRYYDAWGYGREDNRYGVQCQASDGSLLTSNWLYCYVWYDQQDNGEFTVVGVKINGVYYDLK